jgi:hypothetical protein
MTQSTDPKSTNSGQSYKRTSDNLVSLQLLGTVFAIAFGFVGFQWQISTLVSGITSQLTESRLQVQQLKEDIRELKSSIKELSRYQQRI